MTNYASAGPNGDGSKALTKESKVGQVVNFAVTTLAGGALVWLNGVNADSFSDFWWGPLAAAGIGTASGLLSAWLKRNR
jgi:hypothetical protein